MGVTGSGRPSRRDPEDTTSGDTTGKKSPRSVSGGHTLRSEERRDRGWTFPLERKGSDVRFSEMRDSLL